MTARCLVVPLLLLLLLQPASCSSSIRQRSLAFTPPKLKRNNQNTQQTTFVSTTDSLVVSSPDENDVFTDVSTQQQASLQQQQQQQQQQQHGIIKTPLYQLALAGALATMVGDAAMHPMDCIKTLQQSDEGMMLNMPQAATQLWDQYGVGGFYRGLTTYLVTDSGAGAVKFGVYEGLKQWTKRNLRPESLELTLYVCAGIAFVASSAILVPGELLKQQLQMGHYTTLTQAATSILAESGIGGLFAGYEGVCLRDVPYTMMELGLYDSFKTMYLKTRNEELTDNDDEPYTLSIQEEVLCAAITGGMAGFLTTPLDTVKTKLMVDHYSSMLECFQATVLENGVSSLFSGATARVAWLMPFSAIYLPLFDGLKRKLVEVNNNNNNNSQQGPSQS